jgi:hypothetical protein
MPNAAEANPKVSEEEWRLVTNKFFGLYDAFQMPPRRTWALRQALPRHTRRAEYMRLGSPKKRRSSAADPIA